jgi:ribonuclease HI
MAVPKTQTLIKLLNEEGEKITLLWVSGHMRVPGSEAADEEAKTAIIDNLLPTEKYPPQDLDKKGSTKNKKRSENEMKK